MPWGDACCACRLERIAYGWAQARIASDPPHSIQSVSRGAGSVTDSYRRQTDAQLVDLVRGGDVRAFGELWRRHAPSARIFALQETRWFDPDDLVSESFVRALEATLRGGGPQVAFRAYLITTVRNLAIKWALAQRTVNLDESFELMDPLSTDDSQTRQMNRVLAARAFSALPENWQRVLWHVEVEQLKARDVAALLRTTPNAVAAMTYRAREALRQEWIQAHLHTSDLEGQHKFTVSRLGAFVRGGLRKRDRRSVTNHLNDCPSCSKAAAEARRANSQLSFSSMIPSIETVLLWPMKYPPIDGHRLDE